MTMFATQLSVPHPHSGHCRVAWWLITLVWHHAHYHMTGVGRGVVLARAVRIFHHQVGQSHRFIVVGSHRGGIVVVVVVHYFGAVRRRRLDHVPQEMHGQGGQFFFLLLLRSRGGREPHIVRQLVVVDASIGPAGLVVHVSDNVVVVVGIHHVCFV